jgi:hypothetical protein
LREERKDNSHTEKPWWHLPAIALQIVAVIISLISVGMIYYFNQRNPDMKLGIFPLNSGGIVIPTYGQIEPSFPNETAIESNATIEEGYKFANITFQVANTGKGTANDVDVIVKGNPANECIVVEMNVYVGEPTKSNFLSIRKDEYFVGMLLPERFYVLDCFLKWPIASSHEESFVLSVTSSNAGTNEYTILVN